MRRTPKDHVRCSPGFISADANRHLAWRADFALLPGDNDFEPKSLDNYYDGLGALCRTARSSGGGAVVQGWGVYPVQILDGVGAGLQSVAVPGLVARILNGTGRVDVGQGAVMTVQGIGASLSPALGGVIAQVVGYRIAFVALGSFGLGSLALWLTFRSLLKDSCGQGPCADETPQAPAAA